MSIMLVDVGNTQTAIALAREASGETILHPFRLTTDAARAADEYSFWLDHFLQKQQQNPAEITTTLISSVVPRCRFELNRALQALTGTVPIWVTSELMQQQGMKICTDSPQEVGADRLINAYAAYAQTRHASVVVDFGTATTFDVVNEAGDYCGGVIAPGIHLSLEALHRAAAKLPSVEIQKPQKAIGTTTETAMQAGLYYGYLGLIERIVQEIKAETTVHQVIATGGLAPLFAQNTHAIDTLAPDLTMQGLHRLAQVVAG